MSQTKAQLIDPVDGTIVNADINASAAIAGSKISPDFGSQAISTTGGLSIDGATVFNEAGVNVDFRIEGNNEPNLLFVDASEDKISIGTSSPSDVFDVVHAANTAAGISIRNTNNSQGSAFAQLLVSGGDNAKGRVKIEANGAFHTIDEDNNGNLIIEDNGTERIRLDSSGRVLIGKNSTSEAHPLQVQADSNADAIAIYGRSSDDISEISFFENDGTTRVGDIQYRTTELNIRHRSGGAEINFQTTPSGGSVTDRMTITSDGKVGINESSPSSELVVKANDSNESQLQILAGGNGKESQLLFGAPDDADVGSIKYDHNGDVMKFTVATGERMRLTSSGNLFHGRTSAITSNSVNTSNNIEQIGSFTWTLGLHADQAHKVGMTILYSSTNNNHDFLRCQVSGSGGRFVVEGDGDCFNQNGTFGSISDVSLKENIVDAKSQWNDIKNLKIRNYNFKDSTGRPTHTQIGLVAQELETVCPNLVKESEEGLKTVINSVLYMKAIKALQEAMAKIETLEVEVAALKTA